MGMVTLPEESDSARRDDQEAPENEKVHEACGLLAFQELLLAEGVEQNAPESLPDSVKWQVALSSSKERESPVQGDTEKTDRNQNKQSEQRLCN
jgi:hypothetical protein